MTTPLSSPPSIGIFDSGIGGLSVLRHVHAQLPWQPILYFSDSAFAPYGTRTEAQICARSLAVADFLIQQNAKLLLVACNTATASAIGLLRERYPYVPIVGVEPGLKPAAVLSKTGIVGVLATERTLASERFAALQAAVAAATQVRFVLQACSGLADQVEKGELASAATAGLVRRFVEPLIEQGADTLVLGCTHYPFVRPLIEATVRRLTSRPVAIVDTGEAVTHQLARLLNSEPAGTAEPGTIQGFTSGSETALATAFSTLLGMKPPIMRVAGSG